MNNKKRYIKLQGKLLDQTQCIRQVPWLNICAMWLLNAGFEIGEVLEITLEENSIIITKAKKTSSQAES